MLETTIETFLRIKEWKEKNKIIATKNVSVIFELA